MFAAEMQLNPPNRRDAPRSWISGPGSFFNAAERRSLCRIGDISCTGARLKLFDEIDIDAQIELRLPGDTVRMARVVWVEDFECGCMFDEPLPQQSIDALLAAFGNGAGGAPTGGGHA